MEKKEVRHNKDIIREPYIVSLDVHYDFDFE